MGTVWSKAMKTFVTKTDSMGRPTVTLEPSDSRQVLALAAGAPKTLAVPADATVMMVAATNNVWIQYGGTAAVPGADITDGSAPELNPGVRYVAGLSVIGFAAAAPCLVSVIFYRGAR